ncbi:no exine formation 1 [Actinidia rufa]|uniref:No exine formation 1 n=1 Tax=Actinidia rufa TaxID=165716 RepID=A0A7J0FMN9_9ERIC|nr:no exine formation 1 [Actinidia rufa]
MPHGRHDVNVGDVVEIKSQGHSHVHIILKGEVEIDEVNLILKFTLSSSFTSLCSSPQVHIILIAFIFRQNVAAGFPTSLLPPHISASMSASSFPTTADRTSPYPTSAFSGGITPPSHSSSSRSLKNSRISSSTFFAQRQNRRSAGPLRRLPPRPRRRHGCRCPNPRPHAPLSSRPSAPSPLSLLAALLCTEANFLIGVWASLQFKWIQIEYPTIVLALERLLFACVPLTASVLFTWATVSAVGMTHASYYLMAFVCVFYWLFSIPRVSSFKLKQEVSYHGGEVPDDNLILTQLESLCSYVDSITLASVVSHWVSLLVVFSSVASVCDLFLLFFIPFLLQLYASTRGALWWVTRNEHQLRSIRVVNGAVSLVVVVICLEIRVVFHSFGWYIQVPPPLNYILVTITMLGGAAAAGAYALGMVADAFSSVAFTALAVLVSAAGAIVVGFPVLFLPLPSIAGFYLARFFTKKSLPSYFAFVILGGLMVMWFVLHNFWDLNIWLAGMSLKSFCKLIVATRRLHVDHRIGPKAVWVLTCLYSSKVTMLFITSKVALWASAVLLLAVSPPLLLYKDKSRAGSKMKPWQGYVHAGVVALSVWFCREAIFEALQWWNGRSPSDGLLLGSCILLTGLACVPIVALHFSHVMPAKRCLVLIVATGLLFIVLQPPIPLSLTYHSDLIKAARQSADDTTIYGFVTSKPTWPSWLLISAILLTLAAVTSVIPIKVFPSGSHIARAYSRNNGLHLCLCGLHPFAICLKHKAPFMGVCFACGSISCDLFIGRPGKNQKHTRDRDSGIGDIEEENKLTTLLAVEGARTSLLGLYAAIFMLIALEVKFELTSLMREKAVERGGTRHSRSGQSSSATVPPRLRFMQQRRAATVPAFTIKRMAAEGAWMPAVGNVATIMCFAICLILNANLTGGSNRAIFFLAPILLLLNQDSDFVAGFGDKQRYFPVTVAISTYLALTAFYSIWGDLWHGNAGWGLEIGGPDWFFAVKNVALLILTFPSHILFNRFVWSFTKQTDSTPLLTLPLNIPSIVITDVIKVKILGLLGIIYSLAQYVISRQQYISGLKFI